MLLEGLKDMQRLCTYECACAGHSTDSATAEHCPFVHRLHRLLRFYGQDQGLGELLLFQPRRCFYDRYRRWALLLQAAQSGHSGSFKAGMQARLGFCFPTCLPAAGELVYRLLIDPTPPLRVLMNPEESIEYVYMNMQVRGCKQPRRHCAAPTCAVVRQGRLATCCA